MRTNSKHKLVWCGKVRIYGATKVYGVVINGSIKFKETSYKFWIATIFWGPGHVTRILWLNHTTGNSNLGVSGSNFEEDFVSREARFKEVCWQRGLLHTANRLPWGCGGLNPNMEFKELLNFRKSGIPDGTVEYNFDVKRIREFETALILMGH